MIFLTACVLVLLSSPQAHATNGWCAFPPSTPKSFHGGVNEVYSPASKMLAAHREANACIAESKFNIFLATKNEIKCYRPKSVNSENEQANGLPNPLYGVEALGPSAIYNGSPHAEFIFSSTRNCKKGETAQMGLSHPYESGKESKLGSCQDFDNSSAGSDGETPQLSTFQFMHFGADAIACKKAHDQSTRANVNHPDQPKSSSGKRQKQAVSQQTIDATEAAKGTKAAQ